MVFVYCSSHSRAECRDGLLDLLMIRDGCVLCSRSHGFVLSFRIQLHVQTRDSCSVVSTVLVFGVHCWCCIRLCIYLRLQRSFSCTSRICIHSAVMYDYVYSCIIRDMGCRVRLILPHALYYIISLMRSQIEALIPCVSASQTWESAPIVLKRIRRTLN